MGKHDSMRKLLEIAVAVGAVVVVLALAILRTRRNENLKRLPPGPKPWPIIGNLGDLGRMSHEKFANMSTKYGSPLIHLWLGSVHMIVANSIETAKEILKVQDLNWASRPITTAFQELAYNNQNVSMSPYGSAWRNLRKILVVEILTAKRIKNFQTVWVQEIKEAMRTLLQESNGEKAVSIIAKIREHTTNIVTRMIMSKSIFGAHAVADESVRFKQSIASVLVLLGVFHLGDYVPLFKFWDIQGNKKKMRDAHRSLDSFLQSVLDERKEQLAEKRRSGDKELLEKGDFLDVLLGRCVDNDDVDITEERIKGLMQDVIVGGVDSTANTVEWTLAEILRHPKILKQLQDEMDRTVGRERLVDDTDVSKLVYLQAVIKESFRLHPVTPMLIPRLASEACEIGGYFIPAETQALVNVWAIGRDPDVWEKPLDFNPDRFLGNPIDVLGADLELLPFGAGRRKCPGITFGVLMVEYVLAVLIQCCDWSFPPGLTPDFFDMSEGSGIVNHRQNPVNAIVTPRLPGHLLDPVY